MTQPKLSVNTPNGRYYYHPRRSSQVPSITNIMNQHNKPGLKYWAARSAAEYAMDNLAKLQVLDRDEGVQLVRSAPFGKSEASEVGDIVHDWIDRIIKGEQIPADEISAASITARRMLESFYAFIRKYNPVFNAAEFTVWSEKYGYAGTGDWHGKIGNKTVLVDNKTGTRTYWETGLQLAAIAKADFILDDMGNEQPLPVFDSHAILHLRPTSFSLIPIYHIDECFKGFLGLKEMFDLGIQHGDQVLGYAPKIKTSTIPK
jgi:hypothetical protein